MDTYTDWQLSIRRSEEYFFFQLRAAKPRRAMAVFGDGFAFSFSYEIGQPWRRCELARACTYGGGLFSDVTHRLDACGDIWTLYEWPYPTAHAGRLELPWVRLIVPIRVQRLLDRIARLAIRKLHGNGEQTLIDLSDRVQRWTRVYGQGKGTLRYVCNEETRKLIARCRGRGYFDVKMRHIESLALNRTESIWDDAIVRIWRDDSGFIWQAGGVTGSLINHGTMMAPDWSLHT